MSNSNLSLFTKDQLETQQTYLSEIINNYISNGWDSDHLEALLGIRAILETIAGQPTYRLTTAPSRVSPSQPIAARHDPDLAVFLLANNKDASDLDILVYETIESAGPGINNGGIYKQVEFLLDQGVDSRFIASHVGLEIEWEDSLHGESSSENGRPLV